MSTLNQVIMFRSLVNTLNNKQLIVLLSTLIQKCGRDSILAPFCKQYFQSPSNNIDINTVQIATNIVQNIIRAKLDNDESQPTPIKFDTVPSDLIGKIGSYLPQKDHISLSKANRSIYLGCNNPNTLKTLNLEDVNDYSCIKLAKYSRLNHLTVDLSKFSELSLPNHGSTLNRLTHLTLYGDKDQDIDLSSFTSQSAIAFSRITHLELIELGKESDGIPCPTDVGALLAAFPNVEYINFNSCVFDNQFVQQLDVKKTWPKLQGYSHLSNFDHSIANEVIRAFSSSLKSLYLTDSDDIVIPSTLPFTNLQEVQLSGPSQNTFNHILNNSKQLRRLCILGADFDENMDWAEMIPMIFDTQKSLDYLYLESSYDVFEAVCNGIERGLSHLKKNGGDMMVRLRFRGDTRSDHVMQVSRIMHQFIGTGYENFYFVILCNGKAKENSNDIKEGDIFMSKNEEKLSIEQWVNEAYSCWLMKNTRCKMYPYQIKLLMIDSLPIHVV